jgi:hypothetical protein
MFMIFAMNRALRLRSDLNQVWDDLWSSNFKIGANEADERSAELRSRRCKNMRSLILVGRQIFLGCARADTPT